MLVSVAVVLGVTACGGEESAADPPEIEYGRDICANCRMIISDERTAAGLVDEDGDETVFDDVGELVDWVQREGLEGQRVWVHDYRSRRWLEGTKAFFVVGSGTQTPMGTGVVAFGTRDAAEAFVTEQGGTVYAWSEILETWRWRMDEATPSQ